MYACMCISESNVSFKDRMLENKIELNIYLYNYCKEIAFIKLRRVTLHWDTDSIVMVCG